jgi:hypothetical protein
MYSGASRFSQPIEVASFSFSLTLPSYGRNADHHMIARSLGSVVDRRAPHKKGDETRNKQ